MAEKTPPPSREESENEINQPAATSMASNGGKMPTEQNCADNKNALKPRSPAGICVRVFSFLNLVFNALSSLFKFLFGAVGLVVKSFTFGNVVKLFLLEHLWYAWRSIGESSEHQGASLWGGGDPPIYHPKVTQHFSFEPIGYSYDNSRSSYHPPISSPIEDSSSPDVAAIVQRQLRVTNAAARRVASGVGGCYDKDVTAFRVALGMVPIYSLPPVVMDNGTCAVDAETAGKDMFLYNFSCPNEEYESNHNATISTSDSLGDVAETTNDGKKAKKYAADYTTSFKRDRRAVTQKSLAVPPTVVVLDLHLGINPSITGDIAFVRNAVTFLVGQARDLQSGSSKRFEVVVALQTNGGSVAGYGLLAEQLRRLRTEPGVTLTICCDQAALSGGYMMASLASPGHLLAAPFASIGSIGVTTLETLNFNKALEGWGVKPLQFHGGDAKAPISFFGEVDEKDMKRMQERIDAVHEAFRDHVERWRGGSIKDYEAVTNGDYWVGVNALKLGLVDRLATSDEYIDERIRDGDRVLRLVKYRNKNMAEKLGLISSPMFWDEDHDMSVGAPKIVSSMFSSILEKILIFVRSFIELVEKEGDRMNNE